MNGGQRRGSLVRAAVIVTALLVSACVPTVPSGSLPPPAMRPVLLLGTPMTSCGTGGVQSVCGALRVPEDRASPGGRNIDLRVMVVPAAAATPKPDPVFMLAGGPGGAATETFGWAPATFAQLHADRDFVFVDQRGTGGSNRLVIPSLPDLRGLSEAEITAKVQAALEQLPGDPRFYTTYAAMDDLDAVREALGYDKINLYGPSYGATAAQYYMRQHGDHVRAVVLDGGTLLDVPLFEQMPANSQRALEILFARCDGDAACRGAFPNLRSEFAGVISQLTRQSVQTHTPYPYTGESIVLDVRTFAGLVHGSLADVRRLGDLPSLIHAAHVGDWEVVARAVRSSVPPPGSDTQQLVMSQVIRCSEAWARFDPAEVARLGMASYGREAMVQNAIAQAETCRFTPAGLVPEDDAQPVSSTVPTLLIVGDADPQDPPANIADASLELPNSTTVIVPGQSHTVGHLGCMPSIIAAFIQAGSSAGLNVSCAATGVPLPPFRTTAP
jgi:pimeloyl-ACP methyl ester carboxylesterase